MKRIFIGLLAVLMMLGCFGCAEPEGEFTLLETSKFYDSYSVGEKAYFLCYIDVKSNKDTYVKIKATSQKDVNDGFLTSADMTGLADYRTVIPLKKGKNELLVTFVGDCVKDGERQGKRLPEVITFTEATAEEIAIQDASSYVAPDNISVPDELLYDEGITDGTVSE